MSPKKGDKDFQTVSGYTPMKIHLPYAICSWPHVSILPAVNKPISKLIGCFYLHLKIKCSMCSCIRIEQLKLQWHWVWSQNVWD